MSAPSKRCSRCKDLKVLAAFGPNPRAADGHKYACRACSTAASNAYRLAFPDREKAKKEKFRAAHREQLNTERRDYCARNREKVRAAYHVWLNANREKASAATLRWQSRNRERLLVNNRNRRARKKLLLGEVSRHRIADLLRLQKGRCGCCRVRLAKTGHHVDHVMPLALGGRHEDANLQLLCPRCNLSKRAKHPVDFMRSRGFLL